MREFVFSVGVVFFLTGSAKAAGEVVVTLKPLHSLVMSVMGKTGEATLLLSGEASPHGFQFKPSQLKALQEATLIFYLDTRLETFLSQALKTLPPQVSSVSLAQEADVLLLPSRQGSPWEDSNKQGQHVHEHVSHQGRYDWHLWLDPENAKRMVRLITEKLSGLYPENRSLYEENAGVFFEKSERLEAALHLLLAGVRNKPFIVLHDAYQYFERAYGLRGVGSILVDADVMASPAHLKEVRKKLREKGVVCVFREPQFSHRVIRVVTEGTGVRIGTLDPLGARLEQGEALYFHLLNNLSRSFHQCLSE